MTSLLLFLLVGAAEWVLAIVRLNACTAGKAWLAAILVFLEVMLGLWVFRQYAAGNDIAGAAYAVGGALGAYLGVVLKKDTKSC